MANDLIVGVTPVGRVMSEAIFQPSSKGYEGKVLETPVYYIQIAIQKTDPGLDALFANMQAAANAGFFNGEPQRPDFAWKYKDGDDPKYFARGSQQPKEGWAGCYVFTFRTTFTPRAIVDMNNQQILNPSLIKPGYQVQVSYSMKANGNANKPGVYLNFDMVKLIAQDKEIQVGPAAADVFSAPVQANPLQPGAMPAAPGQFAPPAGAPAPGQFAPPAGAPAPPVQPDPSFLTQDPQAPYGRDANGFPISDIPL